MILFPRPRPDPKVFDTASSSTGSPTLVPVPYLVMIIYRCLCNMGYVHGLHNNVCP